MTRWGMVIDVQRCIACWACSISCKAANFLPGDVVWNRLIIGESGNYPVVKKEIYPVLCNHCEDAPCAKVCPTKATTRREEDGVVTIDYDKCIGCRYCMIACPYQSRTYYEDDTEEYFPGQGLTPYETLSRKIRPFQKGTVVKCNLCIERIEEGLKKGLKPGVDRESTPVCVINCPTKARTFGDLEDPTSEVLRLIKERGGRPFHQEFGTGPSVYYVGT